MANPPRHRPDGPEFVTLRARRAMMVSFFTNGILLIAWITRYPTICDILDRNSAQWAELLIASVAGSIGAVIIAGRMLPRLGARKVMLASTICVIGAFLVLLLALHLASVLVFVVGQVLLGASFSFSGMTVTVETAEIERRVGRTIIPQFHASYSLGALVGAAVGAFISKQQVSVQVQALTAAVLFAAVRWWTLRQMLPDEASIVDAAEIAQSKEADRRRIAASPSRLRRLLRVDGTVIIVSLVLFAAITVEGSGSDWISLSVVHSFGQAESVGALVFTGFLVSVASMRAAGSLIIRRFGAIQVLRVSNLTCVVGLAVFAFAPTLPIAVCGVVAWGAGTALLTPIAVAASAVDPAKAARRWATASLISSTLVLAVPPAIGALGTHITTRHAVILLVFALVGSLVASLKMTVPTIARHRELAIDQVASEQMLADAVAELWIDTEPNVAAESALVRQ